MGWGEKQVPRDAPRHLPLYCVQYKLVGTMTAVNEAARLGWVLERCNPKDGWYVMKQIVDVQREA